MSTRAKAAERIADGLQDLIADAVLRNDQIARSYGINVVDLQALGILMRAGGTLGAGDIASRTHLPHSTVTRVIDRLETAGLVSRVRDDADRRRVLVVAHPEKFFQGGRSPYGEIEQVLLRVASAFAVKDLDVVARYLEALTSVAWSDVGSSAESHTPAGGPAARSTSSSRAGRDGN